MSIDVSHAHAVEVGYDEFCGALAARDLKALWSMQAQLLSNVPLPATQPWLWKWDTIYSLAKRAGEIITVERGGDRRVLAFANPGLNGLPFTSSTLWGAIQYLGPGESAPAHRHTPSAIRFVMAGSGVYTTVDGDACDMEPGDLILTPNWNWHDHNDHGSESMVWFDGLDLPLVTTLDAIFFENHPERVQPVIGHNLSERLYVSPGLVDPNAASPPGHSPLLRYRWVDTDRMLESVHAERGGPTATVEYRNPLTGAAVVSTFTCEMHRLYAGERTTTRRKTGSSIYVVFSGRGRTLINSVAFEWGAGDVFVTPSWSAVDHEALERSDVFAICDRPVLQTLRLYREEDLDRQRAVEGQFEPR
jgi:gentisate 1,2-dioxygenase